MVYSLGWCGETNKCIPGFGGTPLNDDCNIETFVQGVIETEAPAEPVLTENRRW